MVVTAEEHENARQLCGEEIGLQTLPLDDSWTRDSGPTFLVNNRNELAATSWRFNAWGNKHRPWFEDARLADRICSTVSAPVYQSPLVFEGGALHVDGCGSVLVTESVVLNDNRNPGISRREAEQELCHALGVENVIWLPGDYDEQETDGHVDGLACFVRPGVILYETNPDPLDPHTAVLEENLAALRLARDINGKPFELIPIEEAVDSEIVGDVFCRSYINFYIANNGIVAPAYGTPKDEEIREQLEQLFPGRTVAMVDLNDIAPGGGGVHCITQQQPVSP
jgi:agmatine deiminase